MDERIRERAYQIWLSEGKPLGRDAEHWDRACRQIEKELGDNGNKVGVNEVPASNIAIHKGPVSSSPTPGLERADGIRTPGIKARRS